MSFENILYTTDNAVATIIVNRPNQLNALNKKTIEELSEALKRAESDSEIKVIILTGSGEKAFVAGADIKEFADFDVAQGKNLSEEGQRKLFNAIPAMTTPVIAAVNGFALGGGLELAMSCHIRIASENAKMGLPEVSLGVIPGYGGTQRLAQLVGRGRALEMILTAQMIDAESAHRMGLVNHVVSHEELMDTAQIMAGKIMRNSSVAISYAIKAVNAGFNGEEQGLMKECEFFGDTFGTEDFKEGTTAFLEKRKPAFPGK